MKVIVPEKELGEIALQHGYPNAKLIRELIAIGYLRGFTRATRKGLHRVILRQIARRFGNVPVAMQQQIEKTTDVDRLERITRELLKVKDLRQVKNLIGPNSNSSLHGSGLNGKEKRIFKAQNFYACLIASS
jgi:Domain of unknown function (DUF4351)